MVLKKNQVSWWPFANLHNGSFPQHFSSYVVISQRSQSREKRTNEVPKAPAPPMGIDAVGVLGTLKLEHWSKQASCSLEIIFYPLWGNHYGEPQGLGRNWGVKNPKFFTIFHRENHGTSTVKFWEVLLN